MTDSSEDSPGRTISVLGRPVPTSTLRLAEPAPSGPQVLADGLLTISRTVLTSAGLGFLVLLGAWLTVEEGFPDVWRDLHLDPVSRASIAYVCAVLGAGGILYALSSASSRTLLGRRLDSLAGTAPERVPVRNVRARALVDGITPTAPLVGLCVALLIAVGVAALLVAPIMIFESDMVAVGLAVLAGALLLAGLVGSALSALRSRGRRAWTLLTDRPRQAWNDGVVRNAERTEKRLRPSDERTIDLGRVHRLTARAQRPLTVVGGVLLGAGPVVGFMAVFLRQPGRNADTLYYDEKGEAAIDVIITSGAVLALAGSAVLLLALVATTVVRALERRALRRHALADDAGSWRPDDAFLRQALDGPPLLWAGGVLLLGLATVVVPAVLALLQVTGDPAHPLTTYRSTIEATAAVSVTVALLGAVAVTVGMPVGVRFRQLLREAWHPGDDPAPAAVTGS
ncbi:hypothetical protein ASE27_12560 [Oerskovia sp. Root918]|uniref:hypothetical protein n=1 Tax=unclassified Oerskovia TaxID=2619021 RepID=UPI0006FB7288|nr:MULTISPECIES: hypothetical protein [unclassified Oerskovia]KRC33193.1 hypothetical protein ASE15_16335 [Oerskovia sp. Root22]KRD35636.1 hypothetical protein ASE27_12560 [Oerskovia sp. Root918]